MKLLAVVQRYGAEVVGGSESHARAMVGRLARKHEVEVATTTALDYWTWAQHYRAGDDAVDGVRVRRFPVAAGRDPGFKAFEQRVLFEAHSFEDELDWPRRQGPHSPALLEFLHRHGEGYDAVLFWTYIYEPTVRGLPIVPERAVLVSTAHDELPLRLLPYRALFQLPRALGFLTPEERDVVHARFRNEHIPHVVLGTGLDPAPEADARAFRARHGIAGTLAVYVGQISEAKGVDELLAAWHGMDATLALVGVPRMDVPVRDDVRLLGRVDDAEKWAALRAADVLVLPSRLESLGIVLLEAWQVGTPVLVQRDNAVTRGQVERSGGGIAYGDAAELRDALARVLADRARLGEAGRAWVERECAWEAVDARLDELVGIAAHA